MSFLSRDQLLELAAFAKVADENTRLKLSRGIIRDENDYTAKFTGAFGDLIGRHSSSGLSATSFMLPTSDERKIGADAAIILANGKESKVAVFEAKWPRFQTPSYEWDHKQKSTGKSHFSHQLERQSVWSPQLAVFEMIYCEYPPHGQPPYLLPEGSSCVWHDDAQVFRANRSNPNSLWTQMELKQLLSKNQIEISRVMLEFGICDKGIPIKMLNPNEIAEEFKLPPIILSVVARAAGNERSLMMEGY
jgi:hypothetical protein